MENYILVWLGKISYCFYSFQFHVLEGMRWLISDEKTGAFGYFALSFLVLMIVSAFAYHLVEEPSRRWIRKRTQGGASAERIAP